ncbi:MAG TPA: hypothetical protein VGI58_09245 [Streptosporangiaceae bacterium]
MRRESSTVVALVGEVSRALLAGLARSANVSVVRRAVGHAQQGADEAPARDESGTGVARPHSDWEAGASALREAARRRSTYVIVPDDPLTAVAAAWRAMWELSGESAAFEERAAEALAAWQDKQFELPDYYLVVAASPAAGLGQDLYLGPLRAARPGRVAVAVAGDSDAEATRLADTLRSLEHGPWWPPLGELLDAARHFYADGLAETQHVPA